MKKRILAGVIYVLIIAVVLSACGGKTELPTINTGEKQVAVDSQKENGTNNSSSSDGDSSNLDDVLTSFIDDYTNMKSPLLDLITEKDSDGTYIFELMPAVSVDMLLASVPMYDLLHGKGKLDLIGIDGYKEMDGRIVRFGAEHIWDDTQTGLYEKGDKFNETGSFDMGKNALIKEEYTERNGKIIKRGIYEIVRLSDDEFLSQSFYSNEGVEAFYVFLSMKKDEMDLIIAEGDKSNVDIQYTSILGAGNISAAEMAEGYQSVLVIKVANGTVTFTKP